MDRTPDLRSELDGFLAEVDAIKSESLAFFDLAPSCEWIVHLDPVTRLSVYQHLPSGQTKPNMPEEYERYLSQFNQFLEKHHHQQQQQLLQSAEDLEQSRDPSAQYDDTSSTRVSKRKHPLPEGEMENAASLSSLHDLLGYSDSSGTEMEQHGGLNARQRRRLKRAHRRQACATGSMTDSIPALTPEPTNFIGPLLPGSVKDTTQELDSTDPEPAQTSPNTEIQNVDVLCAPPQRPRDIEKRFIEDSVQSLLDQFTFFNVALPEIARLHVLFIQLSTRLEDWKCGFLSTKYFKQKIQDLATELTQMVTRGLLPGWTCTWDSDNGRFSYKNDVTGSIQHQPPNSSESIRYPSCRANSIDVKQMNLNNANEFDNKQTRSTGDRTPPTNRSSESKIIGSSFTGDNTTLKYDCQSENQQQPIRMSANTESSPFIAPQASVIVSDDNIIDDLDFGDRTEYLKAQLLEFEEVCRALEYLDACSLTTPDEDRELVAPGAVMNKEMKSEKTKAQDRHAKLPSNPSSGGKTLPGLMQKWQQLQESL